MEASNHIIQITPWEDNDLDLLLLINAPEMMQHLVRTNINTSMHTHQLKILLLMQFIGILTFSLSLNANLNILQETLWVAIIGVIT